MQPTLKARIQEDMKNAMRAKDSARLGVIRLILSAIKQREVDERIELDDSQVLVVLDKMVKQRRDSIDQYGKANRQDLVDQEELELGIIHTYLPPALSAEELSELIEAAITESGAESMKDMGKVMGILRPRIQGRADMGEVSARIKSRLGS